MTYETDIIELYISNNEDKNDFWIGTARWELERNEDEALVEIMKKLKTHFEDQTLLPQKLPDPLGTLLHAALSSVVWRDIAQILIESAKDGAY